MFRTYDQNQPFLLPPSLHDFVDESHVKRHKLCTTKRPDRHEL